MTIEEIGCCGAYCKPCLERLRKNNPAERLCWDCKLGYASGERNINRSRCKVKKFVVSRKEDYRLVLTVLIILAIYYRRFMKEKDMQVSDTKNQSNLSEKTGMTSS
jgi:hypothetical protein